MMVLDLECYYSECRDSFIIILNIFMLSVTMLGVVILSVAMLGVVILSVAKLNIVAPPWGLYSQHFIFFIAF